MKIQSDPFYGMASCEFFNESELLRSISYQIIVIL
ncbi:uncharacterized protein METZ01_LOCUS6430 [marine metagenome]|uniref:Uncharacterized protein n=1 Tax=marine metagenome TaxID=408172 RepID=A0A381NG51_9ZZZZ